MLLEKREWRRFCICNLTCLTRRKSSSRAPQEERTAPLEINLTILSNWFSNIIKPLTGEMVGPECGKEENVNPIIQIYSPRRLLWIGC